MADSEMVERVARAIFQRRYPHASGGNPDAESFVPGNANWTLEVPLARAAIEAMRQPTEAQLDAARDWSLKKYGQGVGNDGATGCWLAMIDAALADRKAQKKSAGRE